MPQLVILKTVCKVNTKIGIIYIDIKKFKLLIKT
jgi:hypothetical protein